MNVPTLVGANANLSQPGYLDVSTFDPPTSETPSNEHNSMAVTFKDGVILGTAYPPSSICITSRPLAQPD